MFFLQIKTEVAPSQGFGLLSQKSFTRCLGKRCLFSPIGTIGMSKHIKLINTYQRDDIVVNCGSTFIKRISVIVELQKAKKT